MPSLVKIPILLLAEEITNLAPRFTAKCQVTTSVYN